MSDPTDSEQEPEIELLDPTDFGPETIDGQRPPGTQTSTPSRAAEPGDPELDADPEDEPSS
jgi:hypothetical protein